MKICKNLQENIIAKNVTMERAEKAAIQTICCLQNTRMELFRKQMEMKFCKNLQKSANQIMRVTNVKKYIKQTLDYGNIIKNVMR